MDGPVRRPLRYRGVSDARIAGVHRRARPVASLVAGDSGRLAAWAASHRTAATVLSAGAWSAAVAVGMAFGGRPARLTLVAGAVVFAAVVVFVVAATVLSRRKVVPVMFGVRVDRRELGSIGHAGFFDDASGAAGPAPDAGGVGVGGGPDGG